jgi:PleD family two-component response regulator
MEERKKNVANSESAGNRMELNKETIIDFEKRNTKVLIADDDDNIRGLIDEILKTEHVPTTVCSSGLEALDLIKR